MRVTMRDVRAAKLCSRGVREFCEKNGLDWGELRKDGLEVEDVERTGDAMALMVVEAARGRQQ